MNFEDDLQAKASVMERDRALDLFTDRYYFTRLLAERIHEPPNQKILFFQGAGGNGKSLLLRYLQQTACKRLPPDLWAQLKPSSDEHNSDERLVQVLTDLPSTGHVFIPSALIDFSSGSKKPTTDAFYGLVKIREELAASMSGKHQKLRFPLHTYGCFLYLKKTNRLNEVDDLFRFEEASLVKDFVGLFQELPAGVGLGLSALKLVNKYSGQKLTHYKRRFGLSEQLVKRLQAIDADKELLPLLPQMLAQDMQAAMSDRSEKTPEKVVLLFDTHEAFYGQDRNRKTNFFRDAWLRRLLRGLLEVPNVVVIVAGRDRPQWDEAGEYELETEISTESVQVESVESLVASDADLFLRKAGVADVAMRDSLIRYASERENAVHPLHLGLCADVVLEAERKERPLTPGDFSDVPEFKQKSKYLIRQLLWYVDEELEDAIYALSACRTFDFALYKVLGEALDFETPRNLFKRLVRFSFIRQVGNTGVRIADKQYRIHDLIRRLGESEVETEAHEVLRRHYEANDELEVIYHVNQLDWVRGVDLWVERFEQALSMSRYERCGVLLDIRQELNIETDFKLGLVSDAEGQYFQNLAKYVLAQQEYKEAITAYNKDLGINPDNTATLNNQGLSLQRLADLQAALSQHQQAEQTYTASIAAYDAALGRAPDLVQILNNKGNSLTKLADLRAALSQHQLAQQTYAASIAA
ncbi:MAG: hypothetical protein AAFQ74_08985, partial [Cyanobacteria bacterium J06623_4]